MSRSTRRGRFLTAGVAATVGVGGLIVAAQSPASAASTVSVNGGTTFQTIDGFGVSEAFGQANSIRNLTGAAQKQALDMLFSPTAGAGFTIRVVQPGHPNSYYHAESVQEDFLILMGECVLIVEDLERRLRTWDSVHCPPMTGHTFVNTGTEPCVILATGNRRDDLERVYARSEAAERYGASVEADTTHPERRGEWVVKRPGSWHELPWARD